MPNYVVTEIKFKTKQDFDKVIKTLDINKKNEFSFNLIKPMPRHVLNKSHDSLGTDSLNDPNNWYQWSVTNWGTKWDASSVNISSKTKTIRFETAWGHPTPILLELSTLFPNIVFEVVYANEDLGQDCSSYKIKDSKITRLRKLSVKHAEELFYKIGAES